MRLTVKQKLNIICEISDIEKKNDSLLTKEEWAELAIAKTEKLFNLQ